MAFPAPNDNDQFDSELHTRIRQNYAAMIENIDRHLGRYLDAIKARGELDNTIIIYSSDHGEMLGDHNRWGKSSYFHPSVCAPLVIAGPGIRQDYLYTQPVLLHDLAATCLDYAGLSMPGDMDTQSLKPALEGSAMQHRPYMLSGLVTSAGASHVVFDGRYYYVEIKGAAPLRFDLELDPLENNNLADSAHTVVERMRDILTKELLRSVQ